VTNIQGKLNSYNLENFKRGLLSTTCLTVACGSSAMAGTVTEPMSAFPNSTPGYLLPVGTTIVNGFAGLKPGEGGLATTEWFEFQGLTPGSSFTMTADYNPQGRRGESGNGESGLRLNVFTDSQTPLFTNQSLEVACCGHTGASVTGTVPGDGFLDVEITAGPQPGSFYQVALAAEAGSAVPEPGTLAPVGLVLAGALAWSRKRRQ